MASKKRISLVQLAAKLYGCPVEELLSYREYENGSVVIIAPSGQKYSYSSESIMQFVLKKVPEVPEEPEVPKVSKVSKVSKVAKVAEVAEGPEGPEVPKVAKVTKVTKVADEHAGTTS